jgi:hypothetical protein
VLDPNYNLVKVTVKRRQPNKWFKRGTLYRRAGRTVDGHRAEIGAAVLRAEDTEAATKADAQSVSLGIQCSLKNHAGKGGASWRGRSGAVVFNRGNMTKLAAPPNW